MISLCEPDFLPSRKPESSSQVHHTIRVHSLHCAGQALDARGTEHIVQRRVEDGVVGVPRQRRAPRERLDARRALAGRVEEDVVARREAPRVVYVQRHAGRAHGREGRIRRAVWVVEEALGERLDVV